MAAAVGGVFIDFRARLARFSSDMNKASSTVQRGGAKMQRSLAGANKNFATVKNSVLSLRTAFTGLFAIAGAAGLTALVRGVNRAVEAVAGIGDVADKIGVTTEELQQFRFAAADAANVVGSVADTALQRFSRRIGEAAQATGTLGKVLEQYGVEVLDAEGRTRNLFDVLEDLADATKGAASEQEQLRIAFNAFDTEGAQLVNLLRKGSQGIRELRDEAVKLGLVFEDETVRGAQRMRDEMGRLEKIISVNMQRALIKLGPTLVRATAALAHFAPAIADALSIPFPDEFKGPKQLGRELEELEALVNRIRRSRSPLTPFPRTRRESEIAERIAELKELKAAAEAADVLLRKALGGEGEDTGDDAAGKKREGAIAQIERMINAMETEATVLGANVEARGTLRAALQAETIAREAGIDGGSAEFQALQERLIEAVGAIDDLAAAERAAAEAQREWEGQLSEARTVIEATLTPQEKYNARIEELTSLLPALTQELGNAAEAQAVLTRATDQAAETRDKEIEGLEDKGKEALDSLSRAAGQLGSDFASIFRDGKVEANEFADVAQRAIDRVLDSLFNALLSKPLDNLFASLLSGGGTGDFFSTAGGILGSAVHGGRVGAGELTRIHPPEMFLPDQPGFIMSRNDTRQLLSHQEAGGAAGQAGFGGAGVNQVNNWYIKDAESLRQSQMQIRAVLAEAVAEGGARGQ